MPTAAAPEAAEDFVTRNDIRADPGGRILQKPYQQINQHKFGNPIKYFRAATCKINNLYLSTGCGPSGSMLPGSASANIESKLPE